MPVREVASALGVALALRLALAVSVVRRKAPACAGQQAEHDRRTARVAAMTGIERARSPPRRSTARPRGRRVPAGARPRAGRHRRDRPGRRRPRRRRQPGRGRVLRTLVGAAFLGASPTPCCSATGTSCSPACRGACSTSWSRGSAGSGRSRSSSLLLPTGMISVLNGAVDDGWDGTLGWFWVACAVTTIVLVLVTKAALQGAPVLGGDGRHRPALPGDPHRLRHRPRRPRRPRRLTGRPASTDQFGAVTVATRSQLTGDSIDMVHATAVWSGTISFGLVASRQAVQRRQQQERLVQPARRPHDGAHPATRRYRPRPAKRCPTSTSSRATRSRRAATSSSTPTSSSRSCRWPPRPSTSRSSSTSTEIDPVFFDSAYYLAPDRPTQAVRAAGAGDGGGRQGRHRPLRDAQQAVHGGDPRRSTAAS